jgi:hypothetical protein
LQCRLSAAAEVGVQSVSIARGLIGIRSQPVVRRGGRIAVLLAGAAALLPGLITLAHADVGTNCEAAFAAPDVPLILTRTVTRALPGGRQIVASRRYQVRFFAEGDGCRIEGEMVSASVEAPPALRVLAELERTRPDTGLFPIHLDGRGRIVSQRIGDDRSATSSAADLLSARVAQAPIAPTERAAASHFVGQVAQSGGESVWPQDLFRPAPGLRTEVRQMPLPDGNIGEVSITSDARTDPVSGRLVSFERTVLTRIGETTRGSRETWTLQPIGDTERIRD